MSLKFGKKIRASNSTGVPTNMNFHYFLDFGGELGPSKQPVHLLREYSLLQDSYFLHGVGAWILNHCLASAFCTNGLKKNLSRSSTVGLS